MHPAQSSPWWRRLAASALAVLLAADLPITHAHGPADYSDLFENARKSVVSVNSLRILERSRQNLPFPFPFPFPAPEGLPQQPEGPDGHYRSFGAGSGVIIDDLGHVITNAHVILDEQNKVVDDVEVVTYDKREHNAVVIGFDTYTDIALLKIELKPGESYPVADIGDSDTLKVGQVVLALGHPLGLDYSLTSGIIGSLRRSLSGSPTDRHVPFIQTDAAINPGNSGGPLLNANGEVIGINARIISGRGGFIGYSLAIPVNVAMNVQETLRQDGKVDRGMLGVSFDPAGIREDDAKVWGLDPERGGILINGVIEGSGAEQAGLQAGDIILEFDGKAIQDPADFPRFIADTKPGRGVRITYFREGVENSVLVTLGSIEANGVLDPDSVQGPAVEQEPYGMLLEEIPAQLQQQLGIDNGVVLAGFNDREGEVDIPQELYKLQRGDIIVGIVVSGKLMPVADPDGLRQIMSELDTDTIGFQVRRGRQRPFFVTVNLGN